MKAREMQVSQETFLKPMNADEADEDAYNDEDMNDEEVKLEARNLHERLDFSE